MPAHFARGLLPLLLVACSPERAGAPGPGPAGSLPEAGPRRIVSTAPSTTEILFGLGLGDKVVGVTRFCDYPEAAKALPKVGGFIDLNLEAILALRPDLVVGERNGSNKPIVEKLESLGVKTSFPPDTTLPEIFAAIRELGRAAGAAEAGEEMARTLERRLEAVRRAAESAPRPRVLFVVGWRPIVIAAEGSFADELLAYAGGRNIAEGSLVPYPTYDMEAILRLAPEVIIDASMEGEGTAETVLARWAEYPELPAVAARRVYIAPAGQLLRPGPRLAEGLRALAKLLHPELSLPE